MISLGLTIAFAVVTVWLARKKGYNPFIWFFASGLIGVATLAVLPDTTNPRLSDVDSSRWARIGNMAGIGIIVAGVAIIILFVNWSAQ